MSELRFILKKYKEWRRSWDYDFWVFLVTLSLNVASMVQASLGIRIICAEPRRKGAVACLMHLVIWGWSSLTSKSRPSFGGQGRNKQVTSTCKSHLPRIAVFISCQIWISAGSTPWRPSISKAQLFIWNAFQTIVNFLCSVCGYAFFRFL